MVPHRIISPGPHIHPASSCLQRWWGCCCRRPLSWFPSLSSKMGGGPLAPDPPCEQVLAAVGVGCWALTPPPFSLALSPVVMVDPHPQTTLRAVACRCEGRCCVVRCCALCVVGGVEADGGVSDVAGLWVHVGTYLVGIPLHRSPGIPLHILTQINTLTSHLDGEEGVWQSWLGGLSRVAASVITSSSSTKKANSTIS